ncbi:hypothetical protein JXA85_03270 [Candidatus Woesearchaeota archaeon]|nr:hypothetical protein [Candidatus Woesearchaeota archaeon]
MDTKALKEIGLTDSEIDVYLRLSDMEQSKVGPIIIATKLASSAVHRALHSLSEKGLVKYIKKGKVKIYRAATPSALIDYMEKKKSQVMEFVSWLKEKSKSSKDNEEAEIYEGMEGIKEMLNELTDGGKECLIFGEEELLRDGDRRLEDKGVKIRRIANAKFPIPEHIRVCNNKVAFFSLGEKKAGYLIKSGEIAGIFSGYFEKIEAE